MRKFILISLLCITTLVAKAQSITSLSNAIENSSYDVWEVIRLTNIERVKNGKHILLTIDLMQWMANIRGEEQVVYYNHARPTGAQWYTVMQEHNFTYTYAAENIAMRQKSSEEVVDCWMNSPGHRANILNDLIKLIGAGMADVNGVKYWVQLFANYDKVEATEARLSSNGRMVILKLLNGMTAYAPYDPSIMTTKNGLEVVNYPSNQFLTLKNGQLPSEAIQNNTLPQNNTAPSNAPDPTNSSNNTPSNNTPSNQSQSIIRKLLDAVK
ncbi:MAG: CAP domain-containing protein [Rikenellaceae bacterium]